jgi:hypothetical protein
MKKSRILLVLVLLISVCYIPSAHQKDDWKLVWADEFNYKGLPDDKKWNYDTGGHGWGNNELQFYTAKREENARVENGMLIIEARKEKWKPANILLPA